MPAYAVLRIKKLKSWGDIAGSDAHNFRERETPNADAERTPDNVTFAGKAEQDSVEAIKAAIGDQNIRKNAVLAVEVLMSASPEYFRPNDEDKAGKYDLARAWEWGETSAQWLRERYGDRVIKAVMHLDEATPHLHATLVPLDDKGKLNCRALFGGSRHTLTELQTDYAKAVEKLGIERGLQGSRAKHQDVAKFYAVTQSKEHPAVPRAKSVDIPPLPGKVERLSDSAMTRFAQEVAASAINTQQLKALPALQALTGENALLKKQAEELRRSNAALSQERDRLKREADQLRGVRCLTSMHGRFQHPPDNTCAYIFRERQSSSFSGRPIQALLHEVIRLLGGKVSPGGGILSALQPHGFFQGAQPLKLLIGNHDNSGPPGLFYDNGLLGRIGDASAEILFGIGGIDGIHSIPFLFACL